MKILEEKILKEGQVLPGNVLKVGNFFNQQIDTILLKDIGVEVKRLFNESQATKILTIESSGIAFAAAAGIEMQIPVVFAKKHHTSNMTGDYYSAAAHSYTHENDYTMIVSSSYINKEDKIIIIDDFLAVGGAMNGLIEIVNQAGAEIVGICAGIEKGFQKGGDKLREAGYHVESLALIDSMEGGKITFR